jgi:hypothetical protein
MAYSVGAKVLTGSGRLGNVVYDNTANIASGGRGVIVLYNDSTYTNEVAANLVNVAALSWISGIGPGA